MINFSNVKYHNVSSYKGYVLLALTNLFFAFQFILRLSPGILREDIMQKFSIDASNFGTLAGYYYLGYSLMQIPIGAMLDRVSFRFVTSLSILTAAIGTLTFVTSDNWNVLLIGRFLIGAGSGVAFLSVAKVIKLYFSDEKQSMLIGLSFTFGLTGAVFGVTPMKILFDYFGYNNTFYMLTFICFLIGISMMAFAKIDLSEQNIKDLRNNTDNLAIQIIKLILTPKILLIGISGALMVGALEGFADLWGIAYFEQIFGMSKTQGAFVVSFVYIGMCFGGPVLAIFSRFFKSEIFTIFLIAWLTIIIFVVIFYTPTLEFIQAAVLMFILGILCCYQVLVFSIVSKIVDNSSAGLAIAVTNSINMAFGHLFHMYIGNAIELNWDGAMSDLGTPLYSRDVFITALSSIPVACFIGQVGFVILYLTTKKKDKK